MDSLFENCISLTSINLSSFDTSQTISMENMFSYCTLLQEIDISNFNLSLVTSMAYMFSFCKLLNSIILPSLTELSVINLSHMFSDCNSLLSLDLSEFDASNAVYMDNMFSGCKYLNYLNLENFDTECVIDMSFMFSGCFSLTSLNLSSFNTISVKLMNGLFYGCESLKSLDLFDFNTESVENMSFMFYKLRSLTSLDLSNFNTSNVEQMHFMFEGCESLTSLNLTNFDTYKIKSMDGVFSGCSNLKYLIISNFDTSAVLSMEYMFYECKSLIELDLSSFDTTLITNFEHMFSGCNSLRRLDVEHFNTTSAIYMQYLFFNCYSLISLNLEEFNTSNVNNMEYMFSGCKKLISVNLDSFDTSLVTNMNYMFSNCHSLKYVKMSNINTSSVLSMAHMFENCFSLVSLNLSSVTTEKLQTTESMFANDDALVYLNFLNADDSKIKSMQNMFLGTLENMVFCINETLSSNINKIINRKGCTEIDCSENWIKSRRLVIASNNKCVDKCPAKTIFFYDYKCYYRCPNETIPEDFICKEPVINQTIIEDNQYCTVKKYFLNTCKRKFYNNLSKKKFIEETTNDMVEGKLYELVLMALENNKHFIINEKTETYSIYALSNKNREKNLTYINLDECGEILNKANNLENNDLIVFKIEYHSPNFKIPIIEYRLFGLFGTKKLSINPCYNLKIHYYIPKIIDNYKDYIYNPLNEYYYEKCIPYASEDNTDLTLYERKNEFNINNMSLCESICEFKDYIDNTIHCECDIKSKFNSFLNTNVSKYDLIYRFETKHQQDNNNIWVVNCLLDIFSKEIIFSNLPSQIILGIIFFSIIGSFIFYFKESNVLYNKFRIAINLVYSENEKDFLNKQKEEKKEKEENNKKKNNNKKLPPTTIYKNKKKSNLDNRISKGKKSKESSSRRAFRLYPDGSNIISTIVNRNKQNTVEIEQKIKTENEKELQIYREKTYNEINSLSYQDAIAQDKRTFLEIYFSVIMTKQLLIFTFNSKNDFNSKIIKICFLLYTFAFTLTLNTLFTNDSVLHDIFIAQGKTDILYNLGNIISVTAISLTVKNILVQIIFTEDNIIGIRENDSYNRKERTRYALAVISIKLCLFFVFDILTLSLMWVYLACFFTIFKNTLFFVLKNTLISFGICMVVPFFLGFISAILRWFSLLTTESQSRIAAYYFSKIFHFFT